jgi:hypothetical protein
MTSGWSKKTKKLYADYVNLLAENINLMKKNAEALLDASKEVSLEMNVEKTK